MLKIAFIVALVCLVICVKNLIDNIRMYNEFKVFNENIRNWSKSLDDEMLFALDQAARKLLLDMDQKIEELNNNDNNNLDEDEENLSDGDN